MNRKEKDDHSSCDESNRRDEISEDSVEKSTNENEKDQKINSSQNIVARLEKIIPEMCSNSKTNPVK